MNEEIITTNSLGRDFAEANEIILDDTNRTRIVFKPQLHPGGVRGDIIRVRKNSDGNLSEPVSVNFNQLHADDGIKIELDTEAVSKLFDKLDQLRRLVNEHGVSRGERVFSVIDARSLVINDENRAAIIEKLLDSGDEFWSELENSGADQVLNFAFNKIHNEREQSLNIFKQHLDSDDWEEGDWQRFFEENQWIFGYGLKYQILNIAQAQPNYGGVAVSGRGGQRGDFLVNSEAELKFTCLVEIKKPSTLLLQSTQYRNGAWGASNELSGAVSQIQVNAATWEIEGSRSASNAEDLAQEGIYTVAPKGIVVIGKLSQLSSNRNKRNSFERFRQNLHNPEIITYDELYERAKFIVNPN